MKFGNNINLRRSMMIGDHSCRWMWRNIQCQRQRGKTYFQILLELSSKLTTEPYWSNKLMMVSLRCHGIEASTQLEKVLNDKTGETQFAEKKEITGGRFFVNLRDEQLWATYRSQFAQKIRTATKEAETICRHEFNLLGSGPVFFGDLIDWHIDPVSGYRWPKRLFCELKGVEKTPSGTEVKLPWELSRMQHLPTLGKAYRLTKDDRYAREIVEQVTQWLDDNPCPYGVNWTCAMDVAIRIMNITWAYLFVRDASAVTNEFRSRLAVSIFQHGQFILFNLEYSLRDDGSIANGNHYLTNIVGLLHLGLLCPQIRNADQWKLVGVKALVEEMDRQVHPDGVNFESSISYHRLVLELFTAGALLCRTNGVTLPDKFWERLEKMFEFVFYVTRPDEKVPQVGDGDDGRLFILSDYTNWDRSDFRYLLSVGAVLFDRGDMKAHAGGLSEDAFWLLGIPSTSAWDGLKHNGGGLESKAFPDAGLYVMRRGDNYLLVCCGNVGTGGLGNHKHNDLLSFELYAGDKAFIVDPGAYVYTRNPEWRNLFRSTQYHNTVVIDGQEQNRFEPCQIFKMTPDSTVIVHEWLSTRDFDHLDVEHTGYTRLDQTMRHRRTFQFNKGAGTWKIVDVLTGAGEHTADWYFHFDSGIDLEHTRDHTFRTCCEGTNLELEAHSDIPLLFQVVDGWVSSRYGQKTRSRVLHIRGKFKSVCRTVLKMKTV